jgi:hypothetical protein
MKRIYIIEYQTESGLHSKEDISIPKKDKIEKEYFDFYDRMLFLARFDKLSSETWLYKNVRAYYFDYENNEITSKIEELKSAL